MLLTLLEVAFLACVIAGVWLWLGVAAALILGGLVGVVACELAERRRTPPEHVADRGPHTAAGATS